jgi:beta-phosphoglucomutase-like phosphatase (HAD superfamily)
MAIELEPGTFDAILFDCDGTLIDTYALHLGSFQRALAAYGLTMERDWYMARGGLTPEGLLLEYERLIAPLPATMDELMKRVTAEFQSNLHTLREIELVADLARTWHGKVPMAVGSNGTHINVRGSLKSAGLLTYFDAIVAIDDVEHGKPAPDVYLEAARRLGVKAQRCVVLEDSEEGMMSASAAGMRAIDVRPLVGR